MSFSPLNPRRKRQPVARSRHSRKARSQPARHLRLWEAIRLTRSELSRWQHQASLVNDLFRQHILPRETRLTGTCGDLTGRLMDCYEQESLDSAEKALLNLWISDNLLALASHPFASASQRNALDFRWQQLLHRQSFSEEDSSSRTVSAGSLLDDLFDDDLDEADEVFDFGWHRGNRSRPARQETERNASATGQEQAHKTASDNSARIRQLEQRLSVERLFRQLARTLHPDREQDEQRKAEKHELMSECLRARHDKDINTLLTLYCEHVGELPVDVSGKDHEELIQALEQQLRQLQSELRQERFGNPLQRQIVERYGDADDERTRQRIQRHADSLDGEIKRLEALFRHLETRDGLLEQLAGRREIEQDRLVIDRLTGYSPGH